MDDNGTAVSASPSPPLSPGPAGDPAGRRNRAGRTGVVLAMVGLVVMAGAGMASRLGGSDSRIDLSAAATDVDDGAATGPESSIPTTGIPTTDRPVTGSPTGGTGLSGTGTPTSGTGLPGTMADPATPATPRGTTVDPGAYGPLGQARVKLACGDTAATRTVTAFEVDQTADGPVGLAWSEPAGRSHPLQVGDQFPAGSRLSWAIVGIQRGPWPVDTVTDSCDAPVPSPAVPAHYTVPPTSVTAPVEGYDPGWTASATLACGDSGGTRRVTSFQPTTNGAGTALLMARDPATGLIQPLAVGDQFPVDHVLSWSIRGIFLGPWPVPTVTDNC